MLINPQDKEQMEKSFNEEEARHNTCLINLQDEAYALGFERGKTAPEEIGPGQMRVNVDGMKRNLASAFNSVCSAVEMERDNSFETDCYKNLNDRLDWLRTCVVCFCFISDERDESNNELPKVADRLKWMNSQD